MNDELRNKLIYLAKNNISSEDVSHDFEHALRVLSNAEAISKEEGGDLDIIIPASLFHDAKVYPKNHPDRYKSQKESSIIAGNILYPLYLEEKIEKKIPYIQKCILECSFSKGIMPESWESKILQDADGLEVTGAIAIMRTYSSTGQMKRPFYNSLDPFCDNRKPDASLFALDLFYERLLKVTERMHTKTAKNIAKRREKFLLNFLEEFKLELEGK
ncbi:MAG: HD domain-containing protein [Candidatus Woesearchaeota archaeon]